MTQDALPARVLWQALNRSCVGPLLHVRLFFGLAFVTFQTTFVLDKAPITRSRMISFY